MPKDERSSIEKSCFFCFCPSSQHFENFIFYFVAPFCKRNP